MQCRFDQSVFRLHVLLFLIVATDAWWSHLHTENRSIANIAEHSLMVKTKLEKYARLDDSARVLWLLQCGILEQYQW
jgi:hypothetical protein